jgi:cytoskeleton protein RodZ
MQSIGEKLRLAREHNALTLDQVARETHVAKRFLKGLEDEDFSVFPGETYAMGFLRNYADYLGLDAEELIALYRNLRIQEQPLPMTELLDVRRKPPRTILILVLAAAVLVLAGGAYLLTRAFSRPAAAAGAPARPAAGEGQLIAFQEEARTRWFSQGDAISVPLGDRSYRIEIAAVAEGLTLKVPGGTIELALGKERLIDLDGDSKPDMRVVWNDADRGSAVKRANLGLSRVTAPAPEVAAAAAADGEGNADIPAPVATPPVRAGAGAPVVLAKADAASPLKLDFTFRTDCLFRFVTDEAEREDRFFQKGEMLSLDAKRQVTVWMSNAGAARMRAGSRDVELGRLGEVAARRMAWRKDAAGGYVLEITPLY